MVDLEKHFPVESTKGGHGGAGKRSMLLARLAQRLHTGTRTHTHGHRLLSAALRLFFFFFFIWMHLLIFFVGGVITTVDTLSEIGR